MQLFIYNMYAIFLIIICDIKWYFYIAVSWLLRQGVNFILPIGTYKFERNAIIWSRSVSFKHAYFCSNASTIFPYLDTIDILYLIHLNSCANRLSIKYQFIQSLENWTYSNKIYAAIYVTHWERRRRFESPCDQEFFQWCSMTNNAINIIN